MSVSRGSTWRGKHVLCAEAQNVCSEEPAPPTAAASRGRRSLTRKAFLLPDVVTYCFIYIHTHTHLFPLMNVSFFNQKIQKLLPWHRDPQVPPLLAR